MPGFHAPGAPGLRVARIALLAALMTSTYCPRAFAGEEDLAALRRELEELTRQNAEMQKRIAEMQKRLDAATPPSQTPASTLSGAPVAAPAAANPPAGPGAGSGASALDQAVAALGQPESGSAGGAPGAGAGAGPTDAPGTSKQDLLSTRIGPASLRLIDVSMDALFAVGGSTANDASLLDLEGGDHDPRKNGFTVQNVELSFVGAVDPYFNAESHIVYTIDPATGDSNVELEEAFATTQALPYGLQVKGGQYFTEFGLINPSHPHTWDWIDQPVINTRLFGPDGMRGPGARVSWLTPLPWFSQVIAGVQNSDGETMSSFFANQGFFDERAIGGRPFVDQSVHGVGDLAWSARWENSWELSPTVTLKAGLSGAFGPNATGASASTQIYGADFKLKWKPGNMGRGWPFVLWQTEVMGRNYKAAAFNDGVTTLGADTLHDWGLYTQALWGFTPGWATGVRFDYASGAGESVGGRESDPFRDDRYRVSPVLIWQITEFSRLRLQYNYDRADHLDSPAHSVWFGMEILFGSHPAHAY